MSDHSSNYTAKDWDEVRLAFASSIMVDTTLSSLAQNLDGPDWPIKGAGETPTAYIDLSFEDMKEMLAMKGYPNHVGALIAILKETLSFDDPFGEMMANHEQASQRDNQLLKNMAKLAIPEGFPIGLTALDTDTKDFCRLEKLGTLGEFAQFAQNMSEAVIVGGDFRKLLNALSHIDESGLANLLPFRPGSLGLHLIECLAQATPADLAGGRTELAIKQFPEEWSALNADLQAGGNLSRHLAVLKDPAAEKRVTETLGTLLKLPKAATVAKKSGMFGAISRLFGK